MASSLLEVWRYRSERDQRPRLSPPSGPREIAKMDHSICKTPLVQEIQLYAYVAGQDPLAAAPHHRHTKQIILIDEPGPDRLCGEVRTSHRNIVRRLSLQVANRLRSTGSRLRSSRLER